MIERSYRQPREKPSSDRVRSLSEHSDKMRFRGWIAMLLGLLPWIVLAKVLGLI